MSHPHLKEDRLPSDTFLLFVPFHPAATGHHKLEPLPCHSGCSTGPQDTCRGKAPVQRSVTSNRWVLFCNSSDPRNLNWKADSNQSVWSTVLSTVCRPCVVHALLNSVLTPQEKGGTTSDWPTLRDTSLFASAYRISTCEGYPSHQAADNIFSHLPMHSQQARVPYLMIPIGGIQMVQARPRSQPTTPSSPTSPPVEGLSLARFESYWGGTPRTQGLRTLGDQWSEHEAAGTSPSGQCRRSAALTRSKLELGTTDSKQYGSLHGSAHTCRPATQSSEQRVTGGCSRAPLSLAVPVDSRLTGRRPEGEEPSCGIDLVEGGAKGDPTGADQST